MRWFVLCVALAMVSGCRSIEAPVVEKGVAPAKAARIPTGNPELLNLAGQIKHGNLVFDAKLDLNGWKVNDLTGVYRDGAYWTLGAVINGVYSVLFSNDGVEIEDALGNYTAAGSASVSNGHVHLEIPTSLMGSGQAYYYRIGTASNLFGVTGEIDGVVDAAQPHGQQVAVE